MSLLPEKFDVEIQADTYTFGWLVVGLFVAGLILLTFYAWVKTKFN